MNAEPEMGDALYLVPGRKPHDELAAALTERQADQAAVEAMRADNLRRADHPVRIWASRDGAEL